MLESRRAPDLTAHQRYAESLELAGLAETALGAAWGEAATQALQRALLVEPPYRETGYFPAEQPTAVAYRVALRRGQALLVTLEVESEQPLQLFVDLFRPLGTVAAASIGARSATAGGTSSSASESAARPAETFRHLASADSAALSLEFEPSRDGEYVIRVQPELLRSARFTVNIQASAALAFPVDSHDVEAIRSGFGAPREAGRRTHHGVDIFARRGTPVVAAANAEVSRVANRGLGGKYIWLRDRERGLSFYYAHLDEQLVRRGQRVRAGDTLGLVGNTGNARTTPPHLHFGIYRRGEGPIDPYHFIHQLPTDPPRLAVDTATLGRWVRTAREGTLQASHARRSDEIAGLARHTVVRVAGGAGRWYRVELPDGRRGYLPGTLLETVDGPVAEEVSVASRPLLETPATRAVALDSLRAGERVPVLGRFEEYLYVRGASGQSGWVASPGR